MASAVASSNSPQTSRYEEFQAQTARTPFVKIPKDVLEATMRDQLATIWQRVLAWIMLYSWGNYSFYAIKDDGTPRLQRDCAAELGISKFAVSKAVRYGITRGYLQKEIKILYPLTNPQLGANCKKVAYSGNLWQLFIEEWKVANSCNFQEMEVARSTIKRIRKVVLSDYKKWLASATNGGPSLYKIQEDLRETDPPPPQPFFVGSNGHVEEEERPPNEPNETPTPTPQPSAVLAPVPSKPEDAFGELKNAYPKHRFDEGKAKRLFKALPKAEQQRVLGKLRSVFLGSDRWRDDGGKWIPWAHTWLDERQYDSNPPPKWSKQSSTAQPSRGDSVVERTAARWARRIANGEPPL